MKTTITKLNGHKIVMYQSIKDLPILRFQGYNIAVMIDAGIGSDLNGISQRVQSLKILIDKKPNEAIKELNNFQQSIVFTIQKTSPSFRSFVFLIKELDGRILNDDDFTDDGIDRILSIINRKRTPVEYIFDFLKSFKKKIDQEFGVLFPDLHSTARSKDHYSKIWNRTKLVLQQIQDDTKDLSKQILEIDNFLIESIKTPNFFGNSGIEIQMTKSFENMCFSLTENNMLPNPQSVTTLTFYQAVERLKEKIRKNKKGANAPQTTKRK